MENAYEIVREFEEKVARWAGAKYGVAVSSCCNAIFLCLEYLKIGTGYILPTISYPKHTYPGAVMAAVHADYEIEFIDIKWAGRYMLVPLKIIDSALSLERNMYTKDCFYCLSFHYKKHLPIGRGGMILTDNKKAVDWLKMARYDGRREMPLHKDNATIVGWNMYLTPEQAARGLTLFDTIKDKNLPDLKVKDQHYADLSKWECFQ